MKGREERVHIWPNIRMPVIEREKMLNFQKRIRTDLKFVQKFHEDPISVLARELEIEINPRSELGEKLLENMRKISKPEKLADLEMHWAAGCAVVSWSPGCAVVSW